jgi:hypothetical protein
MGHGKGNAKRRMHSCERLHPRKERSQINSLMIHLKLLAKQEQEKSKTSREKEIIKLGIS